VLCSRDGVSRNLVFWGGPARCPSPIGDPEADRNWLQGIGRDEIGYSRRIRAVGRGFILRMHEEFGGPEPPTIEHRGIEEYLVKKGLVGAVLLPGKVAEADGAGLSIPRRGLRVPGDGAWKPPPGSGHLASAGSPPGYRFNMTIACSG